MNSLIKYLKGMANAFNSLGIGMRLTLKTFFSPHKILTQQYPENKKTGKKVPNNELYNKYRQCLF